MSEQLREREPDDEELLSWSEFACWTALAIMPFLQWVNGPSVSPDQAIVRTALVVIAVSGAVLLRIVNWKRAGRGRGRRKPAETKRGLTDRADRRLEIKAVS